MPNRGRAGSPAVRAVARLGLLAAGLLLSACTANRMYRPVSVEEHADYSLAFVEFDDQGELWAPSQVERALALLESRLQSGAGAALVLYIHGWNNSAAPSEEREEKGTIYRFRELLVRLKREHRLRYPEYDIPVVGIYMGWRGEVSKVPLIRQLSFYNRRGAAERIAGSSATEAIYRIVTTARADPYARSVLIGHSFGSMIVEQALAQAVVGELLAAPGEELVFPVDLVVLFNPAGSAIKTKQLVDILARNRLKTYRFDDEGNRFERPLLLSFTSESDKATRLYFPLGMGVKAATKKFRGYGSGYCSPISNQRWLYSHTAGHTPALHSHLVSVRPGTPESEDDRRQADDRRLPRGFDAEYDPSTQQMNFSFAGEEHTYTIRRRPRALNDTPYWIMQVPRELIPNHSRIFSADTFALVEAALALSGALESDKSTSLVREDGVRPVAVVPRPDGGALFLDRSRGVYALRPGSRQPVFLSCLSEEVDPSDAVGFHVAGHLAYAALVRVESATENVCRTEVREFRVENTGYRELGRIRIAGNDCYTAAGFDVSGKRVYLGLAGEGRAAILSADLTRDSPSPAELAVMPGSGPVRALYFEAASRRLFATRTERGELWEIALDDPAAPVVRLASAALGWPMAMGFNRQERKLYVTDARNQRIWSLDCVGDCGEPGVFYQAESLEHPTTLEVALDGTIWLGDLREQTLTTLTPAGEVGTTIRSLSGDPVPASGTADPGRPESEPPG